MYCTLADIKNAISEEVIIQLTDDNNLGVINEDNVNQAIQTADAEIDGYCAAKYAVPLNPAPPIIKGLSTEIAVYYLYKRRMAPEKIEKAYDKAVGRLKDISRGLLTLGVDPPPEATSAGGAEANKTEEDRIFTLGKMSGF